VQWLQLPTQFLLEVYAQLPMLVPKRHFIQPGQGKWFQMVYLNAFRFYLTRTIVIYLITAIYLIPFI
jgi:hypothetical protein